MSGTRSQQISAAGGILFVALSLIGQLLIQAGGAEPPFDASAQEIARFFQERDSDLFQVGGFVSALAVVAFLWFVGSLWRALRDAEESSSPLSVARSSHWSG